MAGDEQRLAGAYPQNERAENVDNDSSPLSSPAPTSGVTRTPLFEGECGPGCWIEENAETPLRLEFAEGSSLSGGQVLRLSPAALWFSPDALQRLPAREIRFSLKQGDWSLGPLRGKVVPLDRREQRACVAIKLLGVTMDAGRKIVALMNDLVRRGHARTAHDSSPVLEEITSADRIASILTALAAVGSGGTLSICGKPARASITVVEGDHVTWKTEAPLELSADPQEPLQASIIGYNSVYRFTLTGARASADGVVCPLPVKVERVRHRWFRRVPVRSAVRMRFEHPIWEEVEPTWHEVIDISLGGIRFRTGDDHDVLFTALNLPYIEIETQYGTTIHLRGQVRNVVPGREGEPATCGASVTPLSPEDEIWWMRLVTGMLYDNPTQTSEHLTEPLWDLFKDSGYMNLAGKTEASFTYLKRRISSVSRRAAIAPQLMCQAVWPSERGVEATLSFCKAYKRSWMVHQLAKRKSSEHDIANRAQVLWGIYTRAFEHSQSDPDMRWVISYVESTVPWVARTHFAFAKRFEHTGETLALPVRMMSVHCAETACEPEGLLYDIGPATPWEKMRVLASIAKSRPQGYREALDFTSEHVDLTDVSREWRRFGFEREREILIARGADRKPVAALIVETGEVGTNLFCLLDSARLVSLAPGGPEAYAQLMDEARAWFSERRRTSFLYFREDDDTSYEKAARLHDEPGEPYLCIMSARVLPDFLEHICEVSGNRRAAG